MKWMRARFISEHVENGLLHTDGDIWNEEGTKLLAKSRQMARIISPRKL
jgi:acyl-CoA thioesterase